MIHAQNQYSDYLIDPSFYWLERLFVLWFEDNFQWYQNIREIATCQVNDYTIGCLLDYVYLVL